MHQPLIFFDSLAAFSSVVMKGLVLLLCLALIGQIHAGVITASFGSTGALPGLVNIIAGAEAQPVVTFTANTSIASGEFVSIRMPTSVRLLSASSIAFTATPASFAASASVNSTYNCVILTASASISSGTVVKITFTAVATNPSFGTATGAWSVSTLDSSSNIVDSGSFAGYTTVAGASASSLFFVAKSSTTPTAPAINVGPVAPAFTFTLPMNLGAGATLTIVFPPSSNFTYSSTIISDVRLGSNSGLTAALTPAEGMTLSNSIYTYSSTLNAASAGSISIYMNGGTGITLPISNFNSYAGTVGPFVVTIVSNGVTVVSKSLTATVPAGVIATSCSDSVVSFALSSTTWGAQSSFSASFRTTNIIPIGGSLVVTFPTEINTMFQQVYIASTSVSSAYFDSGASCNLPSCTLPLKALVQIPANTVVSITISKTDGTAAFNVPSSPITSVSFKFTFVSSALQVVDTATVALTIGSNAYSYCTASTYRSAALVKMRFLVGTVATFTANSYGTKFIAAATLALIGVNATGTQNFTIVPSTTVAGSVMYTVAVVTSQADATLATTWGNALSAAVANQNSATGALLYQYLNTSSITVLGNTVSVNMGGILDPTYTPTVQIVSSVSQCTDGSYQVQCTPCGQPQCIRVYPNSWSPAAALRPMMGALLLVASALALLL